MLTGEGGQWTSGLKLKQVSAVASTTEMLD